MKKLPTFAVVAAVLFLIAIVFFIIALTMGGQVNEKTTPVAESVQPSPDETAVLTQEIQELKTQNAQLEEDVQRYGADMKTASEREDAAVLAYSEIQARLDVVNTEAEGYKQAAEAAMEQRDTAIEDRDKVVLLYEKLWRAMTYFDQGRYEDCKVILDEMAALSPEDYLSSTSDSEVILTPAAKYQQMLEYYN